MGKAFVAIADDAQALYFNPGGLFQLNSQEVLISHAQLYGARMEYLAYTLPTREFGGFGLGILNFGAEGIDSRTPENYPYQPTFFSENAFIVSYGYNPFPIVGLGGTVKLLLKNLAQYADVGIGADLGLLLRDLGPFSFGLAMQNVVEPVLTLYSVSDRYPRTIRAGAAVRFIDNRVTITADLTSPIVRKIDSGGKLGAYKLDVRPRGGLEFEILPGVLIQRAGIDLNELSFGLGIHQSWGKMSLGIDYAILIHYQSTFQLAPTHKLGLSLKFGGFRVWIDGFPKLFTPTPEDKTNVLWMDVRCLSRAPVKRWQVIIKNSYGELVRSYSGWDAPPPRLLWDGLDDAGRLVPDGRYYYEMVVVDQRNLSLKSSGLLTTVFTRGPQGKIEIKSRKQ
ncbi:MAG: hypothetical protein ABIK23_00435 [candidate division WOR-3 bacterium]